MLHLPPGFRRNFYQRVVHDNDQQEQSKSNLLLGMYQASIIFCVLERAGARVGNAYRIADSKSAAIELDRAQTCRARSVYFWQEVRGF